MHHGERKDKVSNFILGDDEVGLLLLATNIALYAAMLLVVVMLACAHQADVGRDKRSLALTLFSTVVLSPLATPLVFLQVFTMRSSLCFQNLADSHP